MIQTPCASQHDDMSQQYEKCPFCDANLIHIHTYRYVKNTQLRLKKVLHVYNPCPSLHNIMSLQYEQCPLCSDDLTQYGIIRYIETTILDQDPPQFIEYANEEKRKEYIAYGLLGALGMVIAAPIIAPMFATAGLAGAAATSSGLAVLGGGSLAAGGFGMVGGTAVLATSGAIGAAVIKNINTKNQALYRGLPSKIIQAEHIVTLFNINGFSCVIINAVFDIDTMRYVNPIIYNYYY